MSTVQWSIKVLHGVLRVLVEKSELLTSLTLNAVALCICGPGHRKWWPMTMKLGDKVHLSVLSIFHYSHPTPLLMTFVVYINIRSKRLHPQISTTNKRKPMEIARQYSLEKRRISTKYQRILWWRSRYNGRYQNAGQKLITGLHGRG